MNKVIILLGPSGVGKTSVSILLAKALKTEIISADSMQIYRHMDIGTAKPSKSELKEIPHHLISILPPNESFSAGLFRDNAVRIISELHKKGKTPLIVGGTGLYIKTLTRGLFEGPSADWALREKLLKEEKIKGKGYLYKYLMEVDPESAKKVGPNDTRRIIRALEVTINDDKISEHQKYSTKPESYHFIKIGLTRDREELYSLIDERVDSMVKSGLLKETEEVLKMKPDRTPLQALGYKEMKEHLDGRIAINEAIDLVKKRTRNYAKRQMTWFRKEPDINWVDITGLMDVKKVFEKIVNSVEIIRNII